MAIRNPDGSIYQPSGTLQQFDPNNPETELFNIWDQEAIAIGGTPIFYFEVFISSNTIDELLLEDRGKLWSNSPVCLYGYYEPITSENFMNVFGIDSPNDEIVIELNYKQVLCTLRHTPKIGSRIYSPHKRENWIVKQRAVAEFKLWQELRLQLLCGRFQESLTTGEGKITQKQTDWKVNNVRNCT